MVVMFSQNERNEDLAAGWSLLRIADVVPLRMGRSQVSTVLLFVDFDEGTVVQIDQSAPQEVPIVTAKHFYVAIVHVKNEGRQGFSLGGVNGKFETFVEHRIARVFNYLRLCDMLAHLVHIGPIRVNRVENDHFGVACAVFIRRRQIFGLKEEAAQFLGDGP